MPFKRPYRELTSRSQVNRIRPLADQACRAFGLSDFGLTLLHHGFNTTFRVASERGRFALRINTNSARTLPQIRAEVAWVRALHQDGGIHVAMPQDLVGKAESIAVLDWPESENRATPGKACAVVYSYLPGAKAPRVPEVAQAAGRAMRALHDHAASWAMPSECQLDPMDDVLFGHGFHEQLQAHVDIAPFAETQKRANHALAQLASGMPAIPLHADLHWGNIKWHKGRLAVFDFDDCVLGWPTLDAGITLFYLRSMEGAAELESAFWYGLGSRDQHDPEILEALVAGRQLLLANDLFNLTTADLVSIAPGYAKVAAVRLQRYLETGRFDPSVAPFRP